MQDFWLRLAACDAQGQRAKDSERAVLVRVSLFDRAFPDDATQPICKDADLDLASLDQSSPTRQDIRGVIAKPGVAAVTLEQIGVRLHDWLEGAPAGLALAELAQTADVRLWVECAHPDLVELPWEALAARNADGRHDPLVFRTGWTLIRAAPPVPAVLSNGRSLRVLVLAGNDRLDAAPDGGTPIRAEDDAEMVERTFQRTLWSTHVEVARQPADVTALRRALKDHPPHLLHFVGHGGESPQSNKRALFFRYEEEGTWGWDISEINIDLRQQGAVPRVVVLNACHTSQSLQHSASVAGAFLRAGSLAVVGMQAVVRADYALTFTSSFYEALCAGQPIDQAVARGRDAIRARSGLTTRDWVLPTVTLAAPPADVLPPCAYAEEIRNCQIRQEIFVRQGPFVDRSLERRVALREVLPLEAPQGWPTGVLVRGARQSGKSWFAKRVLAEFHHAGALARYCSLVPGDRGVITARDVLTRLRVGRPGSPLLERLPDGPFAGFDARLAEVEAKLEASGQSSLPLPVVSTLFGEFVNGLREVAKARRVVLVLDQLSGQGGSFPDTEFKSDLYPRLILPILRGAAGMTSVVLVARDPEEIDRYGLESDGALAPEFHVIDVPYFPEKDAALIVREFMGYERESNHLKLEEVFLSTRQMQGPWSPAELEDLWRMVLKLRKRKGN